MKKLILPILLVAAVVAYFFWVDQEREKRQTTQNEERSEQLQELSEFASLHNAETEWQNRLPKVGVIDPLYSIDLEKAFIYPDAKPVMFIASLEDARKVEGRNYLIFSAHMRFTDRLRLELECTSDLIEEILSERPGLFDDYAVIAEVHSVKKLGYIESDEYDVSYSLSDLFFMTGRALAFKTLAGEDQSLNDSTLETLPPD